MKFNTLFSADVFHARKKSGFTQAEVAEMVDISVRNYQYIEQGIFRMATLCSSSSICLIWILTVTGRCWECQRMSNVCDVNNIHVALLYITLQKIFNSARAARPLLSHEEKVGKDSHRGEPFRVFPPKNPLPTRPKGKPFGIPTRN